MRAGEVVSLTMQQKISPVALSTNRSKKPVDRMRGNNPRLAWKVALSNLVFFRECLRAMSSSSIQTIKCSIHRHRPTSNGAISNKVSAYIRPVSIPELYTRPQRTFVNLAVYFHHRTHDLGRISDV